MDPLDYAKTPTGRKFGATGSLVGQPSILERRQAVTDMATLNARRSSDYNRVYRQARRASRQGDMEAGLLALELGDLASKEGVELGGIRRYGQRMNAAEDELDQKIRTNQELIDAEAGNPQAAPAASGAMTVTAQGWTPNETLTTAPVQAQEGIVGGPSGIDATPFRSGPSPAEGGIMAARKRSVSPISSTRDVYSTSPLTPSPLDDPTQFSPSGVSPVKPLSPEDQQWQDEKIWRNNYPALSSFLSRLQEVKDYQLSDPGNMQDTGLGGVSNLITSDLEKEVANYRFDESLPEDEKKRRMAKRAKTERVDLSLAERSRRPARVITSGTTF